MQTAWVASVLVATAIGYDALFPNPPLPAESAHSAVAAIVWLALVLLSALV